LFIVADSGFLQLESGDLLLLESSGSLLLEPNDKAVLVEDGSDVVLAMFADPALWFQDTEQFFNLTLFQPIHFGPNASGTVIGPTIFEIIEGSSDFEIRTPL